MLRLMILISCIICFIRAGGCVFSDAADVFGNKLKSEEAFTDGIKFMEISKENPTGLIQYISRELNKIFVTALSDSYSRGFLRSKEIEDEDEDGIVSYEIDNTDSAYNNYQFKFENFCNGDGVCINGKTNVFKGNIRGRAGVLPDEGGILKISLKDKKDDMKTLFKDSSADGSVKCSSPGVAGLGRGHEEITADKTGEDYLVSIAFKYLIYGSNNKVKSGKMIFWTRANCHEESVFNVTENGVQVTGGATLSLNELNIFNVR